MKASISSKFHFLWRKILDLNNQESFLFCEWNIEMDSWKWLSDELGYLTVIYQMCDMWYPWVDGLLFGRCLKSAFSHPKATGRLLHCVKRSPLACFKLIRAYDSLQIACIYTMSLKANTYSKGTLVPVHFSGLHFKFNNQFTHRESTFYSITLVAHNVYVITQLQLNTRSNNVDTFTIFNNFACVSILMLSVIGVNTCGIVGTNPSPPHHPLAHLPSYPVFMASVIESKELFKSQMLDGKF